MPVRHETFCSKPTLPCALDFGKPAAESSRSAPMAGSPTPRGRQAGFRPTAKSWPCSAEIKAGLVRAGAWAGSAATVMLMLILVPILSPALSAHAAGRQLEACARGRLEVCFELLRRPRLEPGRRAAIEFLLSQIEAGVAGCRAGVLADCAELRRLHPDLPQDLVSPKRP